MELELGLKITKTRDDVTSTSEYQLAKDRAGPVFQSRETNTMFILTAHLKGYKRNNIDIKISEDGSKISISGQKPIQEMLMMGCVMYRKEVEITGFNKVFKVPDGVVLDRIKSNYDEEEWILKIVIPKFVKGICRARIEEVKEEESDRGRSEVEKSEADHILNGVVGETSQKGSKESEVQEMEDNESLMEKVGGVSDKKLDDAKREIIRETIQKEVEESNLGNKDGNGKSVRKKVGNEGYPTMKISELEQNVDVYISQKIGDTSQDKESEVQKMKESENVEKNEGGISNKMLHDANGDIIEEMIQEDIEESKLGIEDGSEIEQNAGAPIMQIIGDTSQRVSNESVKNLESQNGLTEEDTCGESKQKEFGEPKCEAADRLKESVEESSMEQFKAMKTSELDEDVDDHIPRNIDGISQEEFKKSRIQQMEKTESIEGKMNGGESERRPVEANMDIQKNIFGDTLHTIQKDIIKPKIETEDGDQECVNKNAGKVGFDAVITIKEEFPKQLPKATPEESEGLNVSKMKETKDVKEAVVKRKGKAIEYFVEKGESEEPKRMYVEERKDIQKEIMQEKNGIKDSNQQDALENTFKEGFKISNSTTDELPIQVGEKLIEGSKGFEVAKKEELKEVTKEAMTETESLMEKLKGVEPKNRTEESSRVIEKSTITETLQNQVLGTVQENLPKKVVEEIAQDEKDKIELGKVNLKGEGSTKIHVELGEVFEEDTTRDRMEKEIGEPKLQSSDHLSGKENVYIGVFDGSKSSKSPEIRETEDVKEDGSKIEQPVKKLNGDKYEKMQVEENGGFRKDLTRETTPKEIEVPKIQTMEKDKRPLQEEMSKGRLEVNKALKEEFPKKMVDSLANKREGLKGTKIEEAKDVKEVGAEIEQFVKKVKGEKHGKIHVEANEGLRKDRTSETTSKQREDPKIPTKEMDRQRLQEEMSKGKYEASTIAREFPMQMIESLGKTREGPKDKEIEEAEEVKEEVTKLKSEETKVESTAKEKCPQSEDERINQTLKEVAEVKHPKASDIGTPERELQSTKGSTEEVEQGSAKDKTQKTELLPPKIQTKETHESINESVNHDILKPKNAKEVGEGGQSTYNTQSSESTKEVASIEDQVAKPLSAPRLPSTQQSEVDERDKLYEGCKAEYDASLESQKGDPTKDMKILIEMKMNQEPKQRETLKPEIPLEKQLKVGGQVTRKDEFHQGQEVGETIQEETEGPKNKIDDRDQQYVQRDVGKGVGKVETIGKEMHKEENVADAGPIVERMETKRDLKATLEREKYITQNVNDEKPRIEEEIIKDDIEKVDKAKHIAESTKTTQEKEHPRKSEVVKKEAEPLQAISSLPSVTSMEFKEAGGPKNEFEELDLKEFSPLTAAMKTKEPIELAKPIMEGKFPKTREDVPESRDREQYGYGTEDTKAPKIAVSQGAKPSKLQSQRYTPQSIDKENRKSENVVEAIGAYEASKESPKKNIVENEEKESLQPQILENQCFENEQKVDGQEEALSQCGLQEINQEETKGPKILNEDSDQQHVQENNDKKEYQTEKGVEEEWLKQERGAEIVLDKREGPKVAKSEEVKEASRELLKRERGKTTQTAEEKKPKMKEITQEFEKASGFKQVTEKKHETREKEHQRESEEVTSKMKVEPPTMIEITPNKGIGKSQTEEMPPLPMEIQRKEPHELSWPTMEYEIPKIEEVQQEKEGERLIHGLEATTSKEEGLAQATATHSKAKSNVESKGEIDKPKVNQLQSPSTELLSKEPCQLDKFSMKEDNSKAQNKMQEWEEKESTHSIQGTTASEVVADKVFEPSKFSSSSSSPQQFEAEGKDKKDPSHEVGNQEYQESKKRDSKTDVQESKKRDSKTHVQESTKSKTDQEDEQIETIQPESTADQLCINKDHEESHGMHKIAEEKACEEESQVLEEQKECKKKRDDKKGSKKLFVPLVIAGSALLVSLIVIFVRHRRARKRYKCN
ncbi:uncharacterized protein LOC133294653 [Gastrolobium bilobum]|uniref:uncharacterized protein LOC133294653 n=1 Tax=Gastrolobium bilobum TaxID=150636 RepID=UPI002AB11C12|nr:uncharacterized protein LOC133294653 [Gastrolobium bilobum]